MPKSLSRSGSLLRAPFLRVAVPLLAIWLLLSSAGFTATASAYASTGAPQQSTYHNPVIPQTMPDPSIIKALDGYYYLLASSDFWSNNTYHILPTFRSQDLVHWTFVNDAFSARPDWATDDAGLWAPDIRYFNHKYYLYYNVSNTKPLPKYGTTGGSAIGIATADSPAGPWSQTGDAAGGTFQHGPIVPPRSCVYNTDPNCYYWTFDPAEFTDHDGQKYLYYGSYYGGTVVQKLTQDGEHLSGSAVQVGHWDRYEGTYIISHDVGGKHYYYNFSSSSNCCNGPNTGYSVVVNRATSPLGPFVDQNSIPMERPEAQPVPTTRPSDDPAGDNIGAQGGGYPTLKQNGNQWHGVGHNAIITDLAGQDWIVYHGVDANNGWVNNAPFPVTNRQLLIDRLDWTADGWPVVRDGQGPSTESVAPTTTPLFGDNFNTSTSNGSIGTNWQALSGQWSINPGTATTSGFVQQTATDGQALLVSQTALSREQRTRTECDLRLEQASYDGRYGCLVSYSAGPAGKKDGSYFAASIDPTRKALITTFVHNGQTIAGEQTTALPANFDPTDWSHLTIDEDQSQPGLLSFNVTVSDSNRDPLAQQQRSLHGHSFLGSGSIGLLTVNARADFDNITVASLRKHVAPEQVTPAPGQSLGAFSSDFHGSLGTQWSWIREDPSKHGFNSQGQLKIIVNGDLYRDANNATNILLENAPTQDYVVETRITFDPNQNYQQAGLIAYSDDDNYIKVGPSHSDSLNKMLSGHESLEPLYSGATACDVQPSATSNVAVKTYTRDLCPNEGESWDNLTNVRPTLNGSTASDPMVTDWLRLYRHGDVYTPYTSIDGTHWVKGSSWTLKAAGPNFPVKIGLYAFSAGPGNTIPAYFDYVHVSSLAHQG